MPKLELTKALRDEYQQQFDTCEVRTGKVGQVEGIVTRLVSGRSRYSAAVQGLGATLPWHVVGLLHGMEAGFDFSRHLHNGDPLTGRTVQVPAGRPVSGTPPFTWEESAADALSLKRLDRWDDWSVAGTLYKIEEYNGWGYRLYHPDVPTPYLWSFSTHYVSGKYVADGKWSATAVSGQCGAAVLLRSLVQAGLVGLDQPRALAEAGAKAGRRAAKGVRRATRRRPAGARRKKGAGGARRRRARQS